MSEKTITLKSPIEMRSKETGEVIASISELKLRKLKGGDFLAALDDMGSEMKIGALMRTLSARSTSLTTAQIDNLEFEDFMAVIEAVGALFPNGLPTGLMGLS